MFYILYVMYSIVLWSNLSRTHSLLLFVQVKPQRNPNPNPKPNIHVQIKAQFAESQSQLGEVCA